MNKFLEILANYTEEEGITADMNIKTDLGLSSFDIVCIIEDVEEVFGKKLSPKDFATYKTVGELVAALEE